MIAALLAVCGTPLAGCASSGSDKFASLSGATEQGGGACDAFPRPPYQVRGATPYDQEWADKTNEAGIAGCKWERPMPRPSFLDAPPIPPALAPAKREKPKEDPPKKKRFFDRFRKAVS